MDLTVRRQPAPGTRGGGRAGGEDARALAERLTAPLDSAVRLTLLDALSAAADEITRDLAPGSVELRLRGVEPDFVVTPAATDEPASPRPTVAGGRRRPRSTRAESSINLRCPTSSRPDSRRPRGARPLLNSWLVRVVAAVEARDVATASAQLGGRVGQPYTGWVR